MEMSSMQAATDAEEHLRFDALLSRLAADFMKTLPEVVDNRIEGALRDLVLFFGVDRSTVVQQSPEEGAYRVTHSWAREGIEPTPALAIDSEFPWCTDRLLGAESVVFSRLDDLPSEASRDRASFSRVGPRSMAAFPLVSSSGVLGAVTFGTLTRETEWSGTMLQQIRLVAEVFAGALERKQNDLQLREALAHVERLKKRLEAENIVLRETAEELSRSDEIVGVSPELEHVLRQVDQVAPTDTTVLLLGETGTGKELIARAIHRRSRRRDRPLIVVNCAALPPSLIESELFGHERGAFTGALYRKLGRFELANGGTIFLDEVGELPLDLQAKLLRVLQEGEFERVGSTKTRKTDVRVIAATNSDLEERLVDGTFRSDLYYRLRVFPIQLPPLRERSEDIPLLVWHIIGRLRGQQLGSAIQRVPDPVMERLQAHSWPGNVRELQNVIEHAMIVSRGPELELEWSFGDPHRASVSTAEPEIRTLGQVEREHIVRVLESCDWKVQGRGNAAERLGLNPSTLRSRMRKLEIERPRVSSS